MKPSASHSRSRSVGDVRGAAVVAESRELYPNHQAHHGGGQTATHRLRERIERARNANLQG